MNNSIPDDPAPAVETDSDNVPEPSPESLSTSPRLLLSETAKSCLKATHARLTRHAGDHTLSAREIEESKILFAGAASLGTGSRVFEFLAGADTCPTREVKDRPAVRSGGDDFPQFSKLLPELQPLVVAQCDTATLYALLTVSRAISGIARELLYQKHLDFLRSELKERWRLILEREQASWDMYVQNGAEKIAAQIFALQDAEGTDSLFPSPRLLSLQHAYRQAWALAKRSLAIFQRQAQGFAADLRSSRAARDEILPWLESRIGSKKWIEYEAVRNEWDDPESSPRNE